MRLVITNDDGIRSPGLLALRDALATEHEVWTVAPDGNRSGVSHSITLRNPVKVTQVGDRDFSCDGTPVDCMVLVHHDFIPVKPELVISGINIGPNLGSDLVYSGTLAAARQAALFGYPSIAVSLNTFEEPFYFDSAVDFVFQNCDLFVERWTEKQFLNINVPNRREPPKHVEITYPAALIYQTEVERYVAPDGGLYTFYHGDMMGASEEPGSDWKVVTEGHISVCPVEVFPNSRGETDYTADIFRL